MLNLFELEINGYTLIKLRKQNLPSKEFSWVTFGLRIPTISFPFLKKNYLGEWERIFCFSFPTVFQITKTKNISWEVHVRILGFGFALCAQYGY